MLLRFIEMFEQVNPSWFKKAFVAITLAITDLHYLVCWMEITTNGNDVIGFNSVKIIPMRA